MMDKIDNADLPAMPIVENGETGFYESIGLTKREHFAGLAPDKVPNWFYSEWIKTYNPPEEDTLKNNAIYFAWRVYYSDMLLKELAK